jgi:hypothetical protein
MAEVVRAIEDLSAVLFAAEPSVLREAQPDGLNVANTRVYLSEVLAVMCAVYEESCEVVIYSSTPPKLFPALSPMELSSRVKSTPAVYVAKFS